MQSHASEVAARAPDPRRARLILGSASERLRVVVRGLAPDKVGPRIGVLRRERALQRLAALLRKLVAGGGRQFGLPEESIRWRYAAAVALDLCRTIETQGRVRPWADDALLEARLSPRTMDAEVRLCASAFIAGGTFPPECAALAEMFGRLAGE